MTAPELAPPAVDAVPDRSRRRGAARWLVTLAATAVSAYALDAVATVAGLLLAASGVPAALDHRVRWCCSR